MDEYPPYLMPPEIGPRPTPRTLEQAHERFGWLMTIKSDRRKIACDFLGISTDSTLREILRRMDTDLPRVFRDDPYVSIDGIMQPSSFDLRMTFDMWLILGDALIESDENLFWTVSAANKRAICFRKVVIANKLNDREAFTTRLASICADKWRDGLDASLMDLLMIWLENIKISASPTPRRRSAPKD